MCRHLPFPVSTLLLVCGVQVEKLDSECSRLQHELQDSKDQNELLEFRVFELEVSDRILF